MRCSCLHVVIALLQSRAGSRFCKAHVGELLQSLPGCHRTSRHPHSRRMHSRPLPCSIPARALSWIHYGLSAAAGIPGISQRMPCQAPQWASYAGQKLQGRHFKISEELSTRLQCLVLQFCKKDINAQSWFANLQMSPDSKAICRVQCPIANTSGSSPTRAWWEDDEQLGSCHNGKGLHAHLHCCCTPWLMAEVSEIACRLAVRAD